MYLERIYHVCSTRHQNGSSSAKLNVVESGGLDISELNVLDVAARLIGFAKSEGVEISRFALWFKARTEQTNLTVTEATKLLNASKKAAHPAEIEEKFKTSRKGDIYENRYAGRIAIGAAQAQSAKQAKPQSAAVAAFLQG